MEMYANLDQYFLYLVCIGLRMSHQNYSTFLENNGSDKKNFTAKTVLQLGASLYVFCAVAWTYEMSSEQSK